MEIATADDIIVDPISGDEPQDRTGEGVWEGQQSLWSRGRGSWEILLGHSEHFSGSHSEGKRNVGGSFSVYMSESLGGEAQ